MKYRSRPKRSKDRRRFSRTAQKQHVKNIPHMPMRGGIRL